MRPTARRRSELNETIAQVLSDEQKRTPAGRNRLTLAVCCLLCLVLFAPMLSAANILIVRGDESVVHYAAELAESSASRARGLMFREHLPRRIGMWFDFNASTRVAMWMKNTLIPLDMLFVDESGVIRHIHRQAKPHSLAQIRAPQPVRFVFEINAGEATFYNIKVGDRVILLSN